MKDVFYPKNGNLEEIVDDLFIDSLTLHQLDEKCDFLNLIPLSNEKRKEEFLNRIKIDDFVYNYCLSDEERKIVDNKPKTLFRRKFNR